MNEPIRVLSGRQPWFWCLVHLPPDNRKALENRRRRDGKMPPICRHRGPLLLHASDGCARAYYANAIAWIAENVGKDVAALVPPLHELPRGGIIGRALAVAHVEPTGAVRTHPTDPDAADPYDDRCPASIDFRWRMDGSYALVLRDAEPLPFIPCTGGLTLWTPKCQHLDCYVGKKPPQPATHYSFADHPAVKRVLLCDKHTAFEAAPYRTAPLLPG